MKHIAFSCIALTGFAFTTTPEAEAGGGIAISVGGRGYNIGYRSGGYGYGYRSYAPNYRYGHAYGGTRVWHDTSHWDYSPGHYRPHGNHYDYVPPTYHFHRDGHWDHYGPGHFGHGH